MLHLDLTVATGRELNLQDARAVSFGATLMFDRFDEPQEPLRVYADPAGHPFCIFVAASTAPWHWSRPVSGGHVSAASIAVARFVTWPGVSKGGARAVWCDQSAE